MKELFVSRPSEEEVDDSIIEDSLRILQALTQHGDPIMLLYSYYQKQGYVNNLADCWLPPNWYREGVGKESSTYWRCTFQCPLEQTIVCSTVACGLLLQELKDPNPTCTQLSQLSHHWFGDFLVSPKDGLVYFGTKKNAKRSAAFSMLYQLFGSDGIPENMVKSKKDEFFVKSSTTNTNSSISDPKILEKKLRKLSKIPWIHPLHTAGIRKLLIRYRTVVENSALLTPSKVMCELEVRHPTPVQVESDPMDSKEDARNHAVAKLLKQLPPSTNETTATSDTQTTANEKEQILLCDSSYIECRLELPHWVQWNASQSSSIEVLLYEVILSCTDSNTSAVTDRFGLFPTEVTRIGLLLPLCDEFVKGDTILSFQAPFQFQQKGPKYVVKLAHPRRVQLNGSRQDLDDFYTICSNWKMYGTNSPIESLRTRIVKGRHYNFVPLRHDATIDWDIITSVVSNQTRRYLVATRRHGPPLIWSSVLLFFGRIIVPHVWEDGSMKDQLMPVTPLLFMLMFCLLHFFFPSYSYHTEVESLSNRFLYLDTKLNVPLIATTEPISPLTALSLVPGPKNPNLDQSTAANQKRFIDMIRNMHNIRLVHVNLNLLKAYVASKLSDMNRLEVELPANTRTMFLMPELVRILPIPRDFLFTVGSAEKYMMPLEIIINQHIKAQQLHKLACQIGSDVLLTTSPNSDADTSFVDLLMEATTVFPTSRFERLEFLGDRVLNYMIALNMFARNGELNWSQDDYRELCSIAKANMALIDAALRIGMDRVIHAGVIPWKETEATFVIPDAFFSNVTESVLGAAYLHEWNRMGNGALGVLMVGILERLRLPIPQDQDEPRKTWCRYGSVCLEDGYNFDAPSDWRERLEDAENAFDKVPFVRNVLDIKSKLLLSILMKNVSDSDRNEIQVGLGCRTPRLLSLVALFDASLDGSDPSIPIQEDQERLEVAGMLRDSLFHIGSTALDLEMSRDFFLLNPKATPGDLHLLLTCALTHDAVAYIFLKSGFDRCMFDENPMHRHKIIQKITLADSIGEARWATNNGWILPGGLETFQHRIQKFGENLRPGSNAFTTSTVPKYPGLAAGRFCGNGKKSKFSTIDDWQFSFKCIFGYLVLSLGADVAWHKLFRPFLVEVMLLTADEYRTNFKENSTICESYERGNTNCVGGDEH